MVLGPLGRVAISNFERGWSGRRLTLDFQWYFLIRISFCFKLVPFLWIKGIESILVMVQLPAIPFVHTLDGGFRPMTKEVLLTWPYQHTTLVTTLQHETFTIITIMGLRRVLTAHGH